MALRSILPVERHKHKSDVALAIVNIVLLLIFFFLTTGQMLGSADYAVELSETADLPIDNLPKPILIVDKDGSMTLDGEPVASDLLGPALAGETVVHVLIDRDAPASDLIALLSRPELATVEVQLVTIHNTGGDAPGVGQ
jgi:biopolymer transport protein ExbD